METYLQLNSSLNGADALSSRLASQFIKTLALGEEIRTAALVDAGKRIEQVAA